MPLSMDVSEYDLKDHIVEILTRLKHELWYQGTYPLLRCFILFLYCSNFLRLSCNLAFT